jgi:hypothetical protein
VLTPITIPFGSLISIDRSPARIDPGNAAAECSFAISTGTNPSLPTPMRNRFRKQLTPPDKQLAWRDAVFARDLRCCPAGPRRLRHDPKLLVPAPAPSPLNRRDHFDCRHRAMPIVTISIVLRAKSPAKQGSRQKTLTND